MIVLQMFASSPGPWLSLSTGVSDTTVVVRSCFTTFQIRTLVSTFFSYTTEDIYVMLGVLFM